MSNGYSAPNAVPCFRTYATMRALSDRSRIVDSPASQRRTVRSFTRSTRVAYARAESPDAATAASISSASDTGAELTRIFHNQATLHTVHCVVQIVRPGVFTIFSDVGTCTIFLRARQDVQIDCLDMPPAPVEIAPDADEVALIGQRRCTASRALLGAVVLVNRQVVTADWLRIPLVISAVWNHMVCHGVLRFGAGSIALPREYQSRAFALVVKRGISASAVAGPTGGDR